MAEFNPLKVDIDPVFHGQPNTNQNKPQAGAYNILNNQQYVPTVPAEGHFASEAEEIKRKNKTSLVRTYKDDIAEAIKTSHLSSVNIAIAENEKMHSQMGLGSNGNVVSEMPAEEYSKSKIILLISVVIFVVGIVGIGAFYIFNSQSTAPVAQNQVLPSLITTEYKDELNINKIVKDRFVSALSSKINDIQIPVNNLYNSYITTGTSSATRLITSQEFISLANLRMPDQIKRTLRPDYMVGMFSFGQDLPFVIFKTSSFENTYAGMIEWEQYLEKDFTILFRLNTGAGESTLASSLTPTAAHKFEDGVIVNKDVRLLRDADGKINFLYAIIDKDTIVITVNDTAFKELVARLNKEKGLKR